eukprot:15442955-Alexandrium_andersonii.AAC.1
MARFHVEPRQGFQRGALAWVQDAQLGRTGWPRRQQEGGARCKDAGGGRRGVTGRTRGKATTLPRA